MEMVGFKPDLQKKIFAVISAILLLGNIEFVKVRHWSAPSRIHYYQIARLYSIALQFYSPFVVPLLTPALWAYM